MEIDAKIKFKDEFVSITVSSSIENLDDEMLRILTKQIKIPRQHEIEQDYWNLGLSGTLGDEITLVGMMTDQSDVRYENNILTIAVERHN